MLTGTWFNVNVLFKLVINISYCINRYIELLWHFIWIATEVIWGIWCLLQPLYTALAVHLYWQYKCHYTIRVHLLLFVCIFGGRNVFTLLMLYLCMTALRKYCEAAITVQWWRCKTNVQSHSNTIANASQITIALWCIKCTVKAQWKH